jgi:hypothetical protein
MTFDINDGRRPSHLELARRATGETTGDVPDDFRAALDAAKERVPPFDWEVLSKHAARIGEEPAAKAKAPRPWLWTLLPTLVAAVALVVLMPTGNQNGTRSKGGAFLIPSVTYHVLRGEEVFPEDALPALREGDRVLFTVDPAGHDAMVLLSIDGNGTLTTYFPSTGSTPTRVAPRPQELPESIELDAAPGPEVFVAFFGAGSVEEAQAVAERAYAAGGVEGLEDLARERDDVEVSVIRKE